jgi:4-amino-4-deoxy-L-arabinose transferase-like glycosyltransferase
MVDALGIKPPGVVWLAQFFLPLGPLVDDQRALLDSVLICQVVSVAVVFASASRLRTGLGAAMTGAFVLASAPLFVWTSHEYLAEVLLVLSVAWSVLLLALAGRSHNPIAIAAQLPGLAAVAMLAKISSPLYIALPIAATGVLLIPQLRESRADIARWARAPGAVIAALGSITVVLELRSGTAGTSTLHSSTRASPVRTAASTGHNEDSGQSSRSGSTA